MRILVISGGNSNEREVSLKSGQNISEALNRLGHEVINFDPVNGFESLEKYKNMVDLVFPLLHGVQGEDGFVQAILDDLGLKYVGSGVEASKLCFDKNIFKKKLLELGVKTPNWEVVTAEGFANSPTTKRPYVLKPISGGSSIDTFIVRDISNPANIDDSVFEKYSSMLLEELIGGIEITVPILGDKALPVIEIIPPANEEFDYENKYNGKSSEFCPPVNVSKEVQVKAQKIAENIHKRLGVKHLSRTDIIITRSGNLMVLEMNTIPGMTTNSLMPISAEVAGYGVDELTEHLIELSK